MNANEKPSRKGRLLLGASLAKAPRDFWNGLSRQQVPNGISDNASRYGQQEAPKEIYHAFTSFLVEMKANAENYYRIFSFDML